MKIMNISLSETKKTITLSANCKIRKIGFDKVYLTFDKKYKPFLQADASPFATALLLPSMKQGEDLIIKGKISMQLYVGMQKIMQIVLSWDIGLKPINIIVDEIVSDKNYPSISASFFSGGVDSFYTYLKHKHDKKNPITHMLLVNGFDIDPKNKNLWKATQNNIQNIASEENAELIEVESNIRPLIEPILPWDFTHGGCLAAVGLCLRKGIKLIYIPSSYTLQQQFPWGSHPDLDALWSTENLYFIHDGIEASRVNKVAWQIAKSQSALKHLRVCYMNVKDSYNCGKCDKCMRTMINLYLAGVLGKAETFPKKIDINRIASLPIDGEHGAIFHKENLSELKSKNLMPELQAALKISLNNVVINSISPMRRLMLKIIYIDHIFMYGKLFQIAWNTFGRKY